VCLDQRPANGSPAVAGAGSHRAAAAGGRAASVGANHDSPSPGDGNSRRCDNRQVRAMAVTEYGRPLELIEIQEPELRPQTALVEVLTCGVCHSDVKTSTGQMPFSASLVLPHVPGHEICGRVISTDPPGELEGETVVVYHLWPCRRCDRCAAGEDNLCRNPVAWTGFTHPGGLRERIVAPLDRLLPVPPNIDPVHAAPLTCAIGTAYRAVVTRGRVTAGSNVAVIGLGGVGIHALQIARAGGARVLGLDRAEPPIKRALELGCEAASADEAATESRLAASFDVVLDVVGTRDTIEQALKLVRPGGRVVAVGYSLSSPFEVSAPPLVLEERELVGSRYVRLDELARAIHLVAMGEVQVVVDRVRPFEDANTAFDDLRRGSIIGRAVIDVAGIARTRAD
jgi:alcohol dehydrogenase